VRELLLLRTPVALLAMVLSYVACKGLYLRLADPASDLWRQVIQAFPEAVDPEALGEALARLPVLPPLAHALPGMVLLAPLVIVSLWLHDAAFDHMGLWLVGGLRARRTFHLTLVAEAEALKVGVTGAVLGLLPLLPLLPGTGFALTLLAAPVAVYFWILRGHALAAWHGCPLWKGIAATLLNGVLAVAMVLLLIVAGGMLVVLMA
jgi:hypothetical protein